MPPPLDSAVAPYHALSVGSSGCPNCGRTEFFERPRLAALLPWNVLQYSLLLALIGATIHIAFAAGGPTSLIPAGIIGLLMLVFTRTSAGSHWYQGGTGCRGCGSWWNRR